MVDPKCQFFSGDLVVNIILALFHHCRYRNNGLFPVTRVAYWLGFGVCGFIGML